MLSTDNIIPNRYIRGFMKFPYISLSNYSEMLNVAGTLRYSSEWAEAQLDFVI